MDEDWKRAWQPVIDAVGAEITVRDEVADPADAIEAGTLRRYLEPLEFDCALHYDPEVARAHGHADVIAPYTAAISFTMPPMWRPGDPPLFTSSDRDAQPERSVVKPNFPAFFPPFTGYFATDMEIDFIRPVHLGERVSRRSTAKLLSCDPKETSVGRGAFVKTEADLVTETGEVVARTRAGLYLYTPHRGAVQ